MAASTGDDKSDHPETLDEDECSSYNVEESVEAQDEVNVQLQVATDEIAKLKQMLDEARLEIFELRKNVARKRFGIELVRESDKDVHFYTGLPSAAVFDRLLEYLNPDGRRSNVVYRASHCSKVGQRVHRNRTWGGKMEGIRVTDWKTSKFEPGR